MFGWRNHYQKNIPAGSLMREVTEEELDNRNKVKVLMRIYEKKLMLEYAIPNDAIIV